MLARQSCFKIEFGVELVVDSHTVLDDLDSGVRDLFQDS